jgi:two-component system NarL family response regulator
MEARIKLLLVDDHSLFRMGLAELFRTRRDIEVVGLAAHGMEAVEKASLLHPDVILMDLQMPVMDGVKATMTLRGKGFTGAILMFTISERDEDLFGALKNGASGYLLKSAGLDDLTAAIQSVSRGEAAISPAMATKLLGEFRVLASARKPANAAPENALSEREEEVLRLVAGGASNRDVAEKLFITENTVKCHMSAILDKLHFKNRYEVIRYAMDRGIVAA